MDTTNWQLTYPDPVPLVPGAWEAWVNDEDRWVPVVAIISGREGAPTVLVAPPLKEIVYLIRPCLRLSGSGVNTTGISDKETG
jgi:hypothetical protein